MLKASARRKDLALRLDIYRPEADTANLARRPLLLMMHGGAYLLGNKDEVAHRAWCRHFASLGYVAVSINYRLGFRPHKDSVVLAEQHAVEDAAAALAYLLSRVDLHIDPQMVFVAGTSAGAAIALRLAYAPPASMPECRIRAVGNLWGYVHDLSMLENVDVPVLAFQSVRDPLVPYKRGYPLHLARHLSNPVFGCFAIDWKAKTLGIRSDLYPCPEKGHRLQVDKKNQLTDRFYDIQEKMTAFFAEMMAEQ